jgi:hypothetical protein
MLHRCCRRAGCNSGLRLWDHVLWRWCARFAIAGTALYTLLLLSVFLPLLPRDLSRPLHKYDPSMTCLRAIRTDFHVTYDKNIIRRRWRGSLCRAHCVYPRCALRRCTTFKCLCGILARICEGGQVGPWGSLGASLEESRTVPREALAGLSFEVGATSAVEVCGSAAVQWRVRAVLQRCLVIAGATA